MSNKYPVYVISKSRWDSRLTVKALLRMGVDFRVVVEPEEFDQYAAVIDKSKILVLPFSNLGQGSIPARNWVWEHSISIGAERHWILDDNIRMFGRLYKNRVYEVKSPLFFGAMEEFCNRYKNISMAGPQSYTFARQDKQQKPIFLNTRIYSCILIRNDIPYRWRGKYNEDTDLSLRALKDGWCTVLFYAFIMDKATTMQMKGGNTDELYKDDGRLKMAQSLVGQHPDVTTIKQKWGRWQHVVDYSGFKRNKLKLKDGVEIPKGVNNYGMILTRNGQPIA